MKVAVINEVSARGKNLEIIKAIEKTGMQVVNAGMTAESGEPELTYIHTGLMSAILLNLGAVDMVVGGCGTGEGFLISAMQYPGVYCGLINEPLDAWLFSQINAGNCISLALNKGYGWAGNINLEYIFEKLFKDERGKGYPLERSASQAESRARLNAISCIAHRKLEDILKDIDTGIRDRIFSFKPFTDIIKVECGNRELQQHILANYINNTL